MQRLEVSVLDGRTQGLSALDRDGWLTPRPGRFTPGNNRVPIVKDGPGSSVCIAADYRLDGPGSNPGGYEIFRPSRPALGFKQPLVK